MNKNYFLSITIVLIFSLNSIGQTLNDSCQVSLPFCTGMTFNYPAGVNSGSAQLGPNYGCLGSEPNPAWYYLLIDQPGNISIEMHTAPQHDIDFACWGPFTSQIGPCTSQLTGTGSTHHAAGPGGGYPSGNMIDCSYDASWQEWCYIPNAQSGDFYIFMITNYSNQVCNIIFSQINAGQVGAGTTTCGSVANFSGNIYHDENANSIHEITEPGIANALVSIPSCGFYFMSDNNGNYNAYACSTPDTIRPHFNHPYINYSPLYYEITGTTTNKDFGVSLTPNVYDVSTILTNFTPARPGFDYQCMATITNIGTEQNCGTFSLTFDTIFDYISSTPPADTVIGNTVIWDSLCMNIFQINNFNLLFSLDTATTLSTPYEITANYISFQNDTNIINNSDTISNIVVGSYDPNDKQVTPSGEITNLAAAAGQELEYTIRFQNTGTYAATTVRIVDTLSNWLQIPTFTLLSSSHPCTYNISGHGTVEFTFNNINLPDQTTDETGSHGFVKFKVNCKPELANGGNVYNTGRIYFDYNQPIITNTTLTFTKVITTNIPSIKKQATKSISVEPNPAIENVAVNIDYSGKEELTLEVLDYQGRIVMKQPLQINQKTVNINVSNLSKGSYMLRISGKNYFVSEKLIKQ